MAQWRNYSQPGTATDVVLLAELRLFILGAAGSDRFFVVFIKLDHGSRASVVLARARGALRLVFAGLV